MPSQTSPSALDEAFQAASVCEFIEHGLLFEQKTFGFPSEEGIYSYYSPSWIGMMAKRAVSIFREQGMPIFCNTSKPVVTGLCMPSTIESVISFLALVQMGHIVLIASPVFDSPEALDTLAQEAGCSFIVNASDGKTFKGIPMPTQDELAEMKESRDNQGANSNTPTNRRPMNPDETAIMMHSSGTTGRPKLIGKSHRALINMLRHMSGTLHDKNIFIGSWMHWIAGVCMMLFAFVKPAGHCCWPGKEFPSPAASVRAMLRETKPDVVSANATFLISASETHEGIEALKRCVLVANLGGVLPPYIAKRLTEAGVPLVTGYGLTELPIGLDSVASIGDPLYWDYIQVHELLAPHLYFRPLEDSENTARAPAGISSKASPLYELVARPSLPALEKRWANASDGSVHTGDIFVKHPTADRYRCLGRMRDMVRVTPTSDTFVELVTRPYEDTIEKAHRQILDAAVFFGDERAKPGILLFVNSSARGVLDREIRESVWSTVESEMPELCSLSWGVDMLVVVRNAVVPRTAKGEVVRAQVFLSFCHYIDSVYL